MKNNRWVVLVIVIIMCSVYAVAEMKIPKLEQRVSDFTNTLSFQEWQQLDHLLKSFEDSISTQVVVLIINSLEGENIEEYANKVFTQNKIGQAKKDNGVLLVIAKQDYKIRIEVSYGLESVLTDAVISQIISQEITPYFKSDNYFGGIVTGVDAIVHVIVEYQIDSAKKMWASIVRILEFCAALLVYIFFVLTLQKVLKRCSPESRTMNPRSVWFLFIPVFYIIWQFIVVLRVSTSLENEFKRRNIVKELNPSKIIGIASCIFSPINFVHFIVLLSYTHFIISDIFIVYAGIVTSISFLICFIIYWIIIAHYSAEIALPNRMNKL